MKDELLSICEILVSNFNFQFKMKKGGVEVWIEGPHEGLEVEALGSENVEIKNCKS